MPTTGIDQCFLGNEDEEAAAHNPFLVVYNGISGPLPFIVLNKKEYKEGIARYIAVII